MGAPPPRRKSLIETLGPKEPFHIWYYGQLQARLRAYIGFKPIGITITPAAFGTGSKDLQPCTDTPH